MPTVAHPACRCTPTARNTTAHVPSLGSVSPHACQAHGRGSHGHHSRHGRALGLLACPWALQQARARALACLLAPARGRGSHGRCSRQVRALGLLECAWRRSKQGRAPLACLLAPSPWPWKPWVALRASARAGLGEVPLGAAASKRARLGLLAGSLGACCARWRGFVRCGKFFVTAQTSLMSDGWTGTNSLRTTIGGWWVAPPGWERSGTFYAAFEAHGSPPRAPMLAQCAQHHSPLSRPSSLGSVAPHACQAHGRGSHGQRGKQGRALCLLARAWALQQARARASGLLAGAQPMAVAAMGSTASERARWAC